ncbi:MAG: serine/threonine-protein kinase [Polyangiaceae bacterium]
MDLSAGSRLLHYTLERQIGAGGMGTVWAARDGHSGAAVALKLLRASEHEPEIARVRLIREAEATRRIAHAAVVPVVDVFEHTGSPVLVMELLLGETLRSLLLREQPLPLARAAELLLPIAEALNEAHAVGIIHRDLKPENIFIQSVNANAEPSRPRVRLLDFGVARSYEPPPGFEQTPITALGTLVGTLAYMAPEQALRPSEIDHRVDIWAFGVTLYEALSGCRPIEGDTAPETMRQLLVGGITPLGVVRPDLPADVLELVGKILTRQPDKRPSNLDSATQTLRSYSPQG